MKFMISIGYPKVGQFSVHRNHWVFFGLLSHRFLGGRRPVGASRPKRIRENPLGGSGTSYGFWGQSDVVEIALTSGIGMNRRVGFNGPGWGATQADQPASVRIFEWHGVRLGCFRAVGVGPEQSVLG